MKYKGLPTVIANAKKQFNKVKEKYPIFSGYLVISTRFGQMRITDGVLDAFLEFPTFFTTKSINQQADRLIRNDLWQLRLKEKMCSDHKDLDLIRKDIKALQERISDLLIESEIDLDANFEIRFNELDYEMIQEMQNDALFDLELTPKGKAWIRIVLGL